MQILLINENSSVSKLMNLTAEKYDYFLDEIKNIDEIDDKKYDIVFIDDEVDVDLEDIKKRTKCDELVLIGSKGVEKPEEYKYMLSKPFLPNDFKEIVENINLLKKTDEEIMASEELPEEIDLDDDLKIEDLENNNETEVLDKEDIDEVKGLLEDNENEENPVDESSEDENNQDENENVENVENENEDVEDENELIEDKDIENEDIQEVEEKSDKNDDFENLDEESMLELFEEKNKNNDFENNKVEKTNNNNEDEDNMYIENIEEIKKGKKNKKSKKSKKNKKEKKINNSQIKEEIINKLLNIDTLKDVLDGMEIRIKFYKKK